MTLDLFGLLEMPVASPGSEPLKWTLAVKVLCGGDTIAECLLSLTIPRGISPSDPGDAQELPRLFFSDQCSTRGQCCLYPPSTEAAQQMSGDVVLGFNPERCDCVIVSQTGI